MKIKLKNVRGFEGLHEFNIRPITVLIGENSSGKTTLLAAIHAALNRDFPGASNVFNRAPFDMGSFDTIATYRGGAYGRASEFSIGWADDGGKVNFEATFRNDEGTPRLNKYKLSDGTNDLAAAVSRDGVDFEFIYRQSVLERFPRSAPAARPQTVRFSADLKSLQTFRVQDSFRYYMDWSAQRQAGAQHTKNVQDYALIESMRSASSAILRARPHVTALAPLRTRPRRTYDELNEEFKPEGDHIPLVLARLLATKQKEAPKEIGALIRFGTSSGLFEKINVRRLGKQPGDPFQVRVKMKGPDANLVDVGYGVSQALPIVIDSITAREGEMLLVQQPEVHLHPKAQAALGTFFAELTKTAKKQFVIETHSDYLVDRLRIAVSDGILAATDVQLLYFERKGLDINVHELKLDALGNITNAPPGYRSFFLKEELRLMSRGAA